MNQHLTPDSQHLYAQLTQLKQELDSATKSHYNRTNPLNESLANWQVKNKQVTGYDKGTVYDSSTIIGDVSIGEGCWIGPFTMVDGGGGLTIGNSVTLSAQAQIYTHDTLKHTLSGGVMPYEYESVSIGDNCFIGTGAVILKGSHLSNNCLVAAGSVVSGTYEAFSIIGGVPAKKIGTVSKQPDGTIQLNYIQQTESNTRGAT